METIFILLVVGVFLFVGYKLYTSKSSKPNITTGGGTAYVNPQDDPNSDQYIKPLDPFDEKLRRMRDLPEEIE